MREAVGQRLVISWQCRETIATALSACIHSSRHLQPLINAQLSDSLATFPCQSTQPSLAWLLQALTHWWVTAWACTAMKQCPPIIPPMPARLPVCLPAAAGADSLVGDRLGMFSLTLEGHAEAVRFIKSFGLPMLVSNGHQRISAGCVLLVGGWRVAVASSSHLACQCW